MFKIWIFNLTSTFLQKQVNSFDHWVNSHYWWRHCLYMIFGGLDSLRIYIHLTSRSHQFCPGCQFYLLEGPSPQSIRFSQTIDQHLPFFEVRNGLELQGTPRALPLLLLSVHTIFHKMSWVDCIFSFKITSQKKKKIEKKLKLWKT